MKKNKKSEDDLHLEEDDSLISSKTSNISDEKLNEIIKNLKEKIQEISEKIDITMKSALADYIIQRKLIIELYYKLLEGTPKELRRIKGKSIKYEKGTVL